MDALQIVSIVPFVLALVALIVLDHTRPKDRGDRGEPVILGRKAVTIKEIIDRRVRDRRR